MNQYKNLATTSFEIVKVKDFDGFLGHLESIIIKIHYIIPFFRNLYISQDILYGYSFVNVNELAILTK